jgi:hypothetical protein
VAILDHDISKDDMVDRVLALLLRSGRVPTLAAAERLASAEDADESDPLRTPSQLAEERVINSDASRLPSLLQGLESRRKDLRLAERAEQHFLEVGTRIPT